jgi:aspartyl-tRNA(Asn)/glutamyl-tRNA(Gln) amidotransferase subunit B
MAFTDYEVVVGLEVHVQLLTRTKLFCGDTTLFGAAPNTQVSAISLGHPGTLPMLNKEALNLAVKLGLALNCAITRETFFARKNYFYPDLPKGYQVSQHTAPICVGGWVEVPSGETTRHIRLHHIHLEEDAGKMIHDDAGRYSSVDYNRAGTPLLEIVTEPDFRNAEEAFHFVSYLRKLVRQLGVSDGNMEQGSLRCDVNISVRKLGVTALGTKNEIKNLNSLRFIKKAIGYEAIRLIGLVEKGETIIQQTRGFDEATETTYAIRTKEDEDDYRYFPEPDLPPFFISDELITSIQQSLPPAEATLKAELQASYGLNDYDAGQLAADYQLTQFFQGTVAAGAPAKAAANWILGTVRNTMLQKDVDEPTVTATQLASLIRLVEDGRINHGTATQKVWPQLWAHADLDLLNFIEVNNLSLQSDTGELETLIEAALQKHAGKITEYKKGKKGLLSLFVGEVMKSSKGKADAQLVTELIAQKLK